MIPSYTSSDFWDRHPWLRWAATWGLSIVSLVSGVLTLSLFRRGLEYFPWVVGYLLLLWLAGVVFAHVREALEARGRRLVRVAYDYLLQSLYWHLLLFLLPIYYASTTLASPNVVFLALLAAATLLTGIDPWYRATILRHPWAANLLFGLSLFASLNVAFPLVGVPTAPALVGAAAVSVLALAPAIRRSFRLSWRGAGLAAAAGAAVALFIVWQARVWIPPTPLSMVRGTFAREVRDLEPVAPVSRVAAAEAREWGGLVCFTALAAPAGLREPIVHAWRRDGVTVARIPLAPVRGGRPGGFRTHSRLASLGADPAGHWRADVLTAQGQLIGRVHLTINGP